MQFKELIEAARQSAREAIERIAEDAQSYTVEDAVDAVRLAGRVEKQAVLLEQMQGVNIAPDDADRLTESVYLPDDTSGFNAIEIQGVAEVPDPDPGCEGQMLVEVDNSDPTFFSVYLHRTEGGVECVGDFDTADMARNYAAIVSKWCALPIYDYTPKASAGLEMKP